MDTTQPIDFERLVSYLAGECGEEEAARIEEAARDNAELRETLRRLTFLWSAAEGGDVQEDTFDVEAGWRGLIRHLEDRGLPSPESGSVTRIRESTVRTPHLGQFLRVAAVLLVVIGGTFIASRFFGADDPVDVPVAMQEIATGQGQRATAQLTDGTQVHLGVDSRLRFVAGFAPGERRVQLDGEVWFDVARDEARPFVIETRDAIVEVLGTTFAVRAYPGDADVQVVVEEGTVVLRSDMSSLRDTVQLRARHLGRVNAGRVEAIRDAGDLERYFAWREGRLIFENAPIEEVIAELERWYRLEVHLAVSPMSVSRLNASFGDEPLSEILNSIAAALNLRYERERREITFYPAAAGLP